MTERAPPPSARLPATAPASSVPGAGQRSRNTRDKPAVFCFESSKSAALPERPCQALFSRRSPPEDLRKITPGARFPATARLQACPAQNGSRNTRDKPAVFYSESSERRRAPRAPIAPSADETPPDAVVPRACCFRDAPELHEKARGADHIDPLRAPVQLRLFKSSAVKDAITSRPSRRPSASAPRRRWCRRHWPSACRRTLRPVP